MSRNSATMSETDLSTDENAEKKKKDAPPIQKKEVDNSHSISQEEFL